MSDETIKDFSDYTNRAMFFAEYMSDSYPYFGLVEEVGEFMGLFAKAHRGDDMVERFGSEEAVSDYVKKELGDILWMLTAVTEDMGYSLEEIATLNVNKLQDRANRGVIKGSGDNR